MLWQTLSPPWQTAVSLAWEAYCAGSLPIGAVIVDGDGRIVAQGRNSIHETKSSSPLQGSRLAHAEMNALVALSQSGVEAESCTLYSTMEPCVMCMGAIRMMRLGAVHFAGPDPFAGSACLVETAVPQTNRVIGLGQRLFATGELRQVDQQSVATEAMLIWLEERLIC